MFRFMPQATAIGLVLGACSSASGPPPAAAPAPAPEVALDLDLAPEAPPAPPPRAVVSLPSVRAGAYRLRLSTSCRAGERTISGQLTLKRISGTDAPLGNDASGAGPLLWGQTDLNVESLESCLAQPHLARGEPIHPGVLVEVLHWDGQPQHQVLLVSTESHPKKGKLDGATRGVAMWVEQVAAGHLSGVWCRWELMSRGEGHWEADLVEP
jgi:hypothetical protein